MVASNRHCWGNQGPGQYSSHTNSRAGRNYTSGSLLKESCFIILSGFEQFQSFLFNFLLLANSCSPKFHCCPHIQFLHFIAKIVIKLHCIALQLFNLLIPIAFIYYYERKSLISLAKKLKITSNAFL